MSDVRVEFSADIKDLQKGIKDAQGELKGFKKAVDNTQKSTKKFGDVAGDSAKDIDKAAEAARKARQFVEEIRRSSTGAAPALEGVKGAAGGVAGELANLAVKSGAAQGSVARLAGSFTKAGGLLIVADLASEAILFLAAKATESFRKMREEAAEAQKAFASAVDELVNIQGSTKLEIAFANRDDVLAAIRQTKANIASLQESQGTPNKIKGTQFGSVVSPDSRSFQLSRKANAERIKEEETILATLEAQVLELDSQIKVANRLRDLRAGDVITLGDSDLSIPGGAEIVSPIDRSTLDDLKQFEQLRIDAISKNIELAKSFDVVTAALDRENNALFDQREAAEAKALQDEIAINNNNRIAESSRQASTQLENVGQLIAVELGQEAAASVSELVLGFSSLEEVLGNIKGVLRNVVAQIAAAAAKAAILSVLFPSAGGFKSLFKSGLGLTPFAKGGIVTGPTPALVGEAGPEAIIPLSQLGGIMSQRLEVVPAVLPSGDILVGLREANNRRDGRGGRINI